MDTLSQVMKVAAQTDRHCLEVDAPSQSPDDVVGSHNDGKSASLIKIVVT